MALTAAQVAQFGATIKANITASPDLIGQQDTAIAALYNAAASPAFYVWKSSVSIDDVTRADNFDWTRVDNLSVGKARIWEWMFDGTNAINPSKANVRIGINSVWVGTQADLNVRAVVYEACQRQANRIEKLLVVSGAGTSVVNGVGPATLGFEGTISAQNVSDILAAF
jgi:hypothetical protein